MARVDLPAPVASLILQLRRLPGVGPRSAERMALALLQDREGFPAKLAATLTATTQVVRPCRACGFFADASSGDLVCPICADPARDLSLLCVVEQATDILPMERSGAFKGHYHTLGGRLAPLDHVGPGDLRIAELQERLRASACREVILALSGDVEGEATASYLMELLRPLELRVSRLAQGMPAGGALDAADEITLSRALTYRVPFRS